MDEAFYEPAPVAPESTDKETLPLFGDEPSAEAAPSDPATPADVPEGAGE